MPEYKFTPKKPFSNGTIRRTAEWNKENPPSYNSYLTEAKEWEDLHLDNHQNNNEDICSKVVRASTGSARVSAATITAPRHAYIPHERETISGSKAQDTGATESVGPEWSCESNPDSPCRTEPTRLEDPRDNTENSGVVSSSKTTHNSSSWLNRLSTQCTHAFGATITAPRQVHFPGDRKLEQTPKEHLSGIDAHVDPLGDLDRESRPTGRKGCNGFDKTRKLLAKILMERTSGMDGSASRPHAKSPKNVAPSNQILYETAADGFIRWALEFYLKNRDRYGPGTTVHDFMIVKLMDEEYGLPGDGETKEYLYGEWEYLWVDDGDGVCENETHVPAKITQLPHPPSIKNRLCVLGNLGPTAEDWKWWFGEWKKVPGAIWEWKPREEIWPWQRSYWTEA
ncbi:hypothetical protein EYC84_005629 [Monilinia fructicola]|uniref:Uncharacterized protein n=1 Tax=Monilinia fructicola TaxID=38448 RepID=A0A5M9JZM5_MONFR|nr:hypothetical protein EYC84_005629 [Monilinia fructicola]